MCGLASGRNDMKSSKPDSINNNSKFEMIVCRQEGIECQLVRMVLRNESAPLARESKMK